MCDEQRLWQHWTDGTGLSEQLPVNASENSRLQRGEEKRRACPPSSTRVTRFGVTVAPHGN